MAMGGAYAAGAGMVQKEESYVPLMRSYTDMARVRTPSVGSGGMGGRPSYGRRGGGSSAATEIQRRRLRMEEQEAERARQAEWSRRNQYMAAHHGREPTPEEMAEVQYGREAEQKGLEREERARQFDVTAAAQEKERGLRREEVTRKKEDVSGLKEREDVRRGQKHRREMTKKDMEIDKERRTVDHENMMKAFMTGDYQEVSAWFIKEGEPGTDESLSYPIIEPTEDAETISVTWPGQEGPQMMQKDMLGQLFARMSPKFEERPKQKKPEKAMSKRDAAKAAATYAKGVSERGDQDYEEAYQEKYAELMAGTQEKQPKRGEKTVTRRQRNRATGQIRITYSDGTTEIQ